MYCQLFPNGSNAVCNFLDIPSDILFSDCGGGPSSYLLLLLLDYGIYGGALYIFQTQQQHWYIDLVGCWSGYMGAYKVSHIYFSTGYY